MARRQRIDQAALARAKREIAEPAEDDRDDDREADGLHDGTSWRFDAPEDTEGGSAD